MVETLERSAILTEAQNRERRTLAQEQGQVMSKDEYLATLPKVLDSRYLIENLTEGEVYDVKADAGLRRVRVW